jgi:hypothetical protein
MAYSREFEEIGKKRILEFNPHLGTTVIGKNFTMSTRVIELEESVKKLSHDEFLEFQRWFEGFEETQSASANLHEGAKRQEWEDFIERTWGMFADFPLERPEQKAWTKREEW